MSDKDFFILCVVFIVIFYIGLVIGDYVALQAHHCIPCVAPLVPLGSAP